MSGKSMFVFVLLCGVLLLPAASASLRVPSPAQNPPAASVLAQLPMQPRVEARGFANEARYEENKEVNRLIDIADGLAREGEWQPAIMHYQKALEVVLDKCPDGLAAVANTDAPGLIYNKPYGEIIRERLLSMDSTEVAFYRAQFERSAAMALARARRARDFAAIVDVAQRWPFTQSGRKATTAAADIAAERGDFFTAARGYLNLAEVIKAWPPYSPQEYAAALAGAASAYAAVGSRMGLDRVEALAKADPAALSAKLRLVGKPLTLGAHLATLSKTVARPAPAVLRDWPILGGDSTRSRAFVDDGGEIGAEMWRYEIDYEGKALHGRAYKTGETFSTVLTVPVPVFSDGCVYVNTGYGLVALDAFGGRSVFEKHPGNVAMERTRYRYREMRGKIDAATVHNSIIYAVASPGLRKYGFVSVCLRKLLAVDAGTGRVIWDSYSQTGLNEDYFVCGSPVVYRDSVVFQARRIEGVLIKYYLVCADAKTGALMWRTALAAAPLTSSYYIRREAASLTAVSGNIAVVQSGSSTITAVNLDSGRIIWGVKYDRDSINPVSSNQLNSPSYGQRWCANPPMIVGDRVIVKPADSFRIMCMSIDDGRLLWSKKDPRIAYLAGIDGDSLFVVGPGVGEIDIMTGKTLFEDQYSTVTKKGQTQYRLAPLTGRPALARDALYISTRTSLYRFDRAEKKLKKSFDWEDRNMLPGNLLITADGFFVANSEEVVACYVPSVIGVMTEKLKKNPGDPLLLLRRAVGLLGFGRAEEALKDLNLALEKSDPQRQYAGRPLRETVTIMKGLCYSALADQQTDPRKAVEMAKLALQHAVRRDRIVLTTCALADKQAALGGEAMTQAVAGLQKIIKEYPDEMMRFGNHFEQSAAYYATNRLAALLRRHGREGYAPTEGEAQKLFDAAFPTSSRADMLDVCRFYPNSIAYLKAIAWLTDRKNGGVGPGFEAAALRVALSRCADTPLFAPWLIRLQQLAQDTGDRELETRTLERLASLPPETNAPMDGRDVAVADYAKKRLAEIADLVANDGTQPPLPKDSVLLFEDTYYTKNFPQQARLRFLKPQGLRPEIMRDKILLCRNSVVECVSLKTGKRLWAGYPGRQWMGLSIEIDPKTRRMFIKVVYPGRNAAKAGLKVNDTLLTINGVKMNSFTAFRRTLDAAKDGDKMRLEILRGTVRKTAVIVAEPIPAHFSSNLTNAWYMGRNRLVVVATYPNLALRCIDLKDGGVVWERTGLPKRQNTSKLPEPLRANAGSLKTNGLFSYFDSSGGVGAIVTIDLNDGRDVARLNVDKRKFMSFAIAGGLYLIQHDNKCVARDILTGTVRYKFTLTPTPPHRNYISYRQAITATADRTLVFADYRHSVTAVDLVGAAEISVGPADINQKLQTRRSERYIMALNILKPFAHSSGGVFHLIDGVRFEVIRDIQISAGIGDAVFYEKTVLFPRVSGDKNICAVYDLEKRSLTYGKKQSKDQYKKLQYHKPGGRYVILMGSYNKAVPPNPSPPNTLQKQESEFGTVVLEAATGKEIYRYTTTINHVRYTDARIIDGRLCIIYGSKMTVLGKNSPAK